MKNIKNMGKQQRVKAQKSLAGSGFGGGMAGKKPIGRGSSMLDTADRYAAGGAAKSRKKFKRA